MSDAEVEELRLALSSAAPSLNIKALAAHAQASLKNVSDLEDIVQTLASMNNARVGADVSAKDFAHDVAEQFGSRRDKPPPGADTLERKLTALLEVQPLVASAKAFDLQHEYEKLFMAARIVSDTRTAFNQAGTEAVGTMIVHNLNIKYSENGQFKEVFIAMDGADLAKLRRVLDRAETKTAVLEKLIEKTGVRYLDSK